LLLLPLLQPFLWQLLCSLLLCTLLVLLLLQLLRWLPLPLPGPLPLLLLLRLLPHLLPVPLLLLRLLSRLLLCLLRLPVRGTGARRQVLVDLGCGAAGIQVCLLSGSSHKGRAPAVQQGAKGIDGRPHDSTGLGCSGAQAAVLR
jgi:hypothetical protein